MIALFIPPRNYCPFIQEVAEINFKSALREAEKERSKKRTAEPPNE